MTDTGFISSANDAGKAERLLGEFGMYLLGLPDICVVTEKELNDPEWEPPFDCGLVVYNMVYHGDENSPHIHMPYIPYARNLKRGCSCRMHLQKHLREWAMRRQWNRLLIKMAIWCGKMIKTAIRFRR